MDGQTDGQADIGIDRGIEGWIEGWIMDGWTDYNRQFNITKVKYH